MGQIYLEGVRKNCTQLFYMLNIRFLLIKNFLENQFSKWVKNYKERNYNEAMVSCKLFTIFFHNFPYQDIA